MKTKRNLKIEEYQLLEYLLEEVEQYNFNINSLKVIDMFDGGMGSIYIVNPKKEREDRKMNTCIVEKFFKDRDDVLISVCLNIDADDKLFELDIWRVDFNSIQDYPKRKTVVIMGI